MEHDPENVAPLQGRHAFSFEVLMHVCCHRCGRWFTISDTRHANILYCPYCGHEAPVAEIK